MGERLLGDKERWEVLYVKSDGRVASLKPSGWRWSDLERSPFFGILEVKMGGEEARAVLERMTEFRVDEGKKELVHSVYGRNWKHLGKKDYRKGSDELYADELVPGWRESGKKAVEVLHPKHWPFDSETNFSDERKSFLRRLAPIEDRPGMAELLASVREGCYGDIIANVRALSSDVLREGLGYLDGPDRAWAEWIARIRNAY